MAKKVRVILLDKLDNYGQAGDIIDISEGYARNYLFPQGLAALATVQAANQSRAKKDREEKANRQKLAEAQAQADKLDGTELKLTARLKEGDEIYGKITARDIAKALKQQASITLSIKDINLPEPITATGTYDVILSLSADIEAKILVTVEADPDSLPKTDE